MIPKLFRSLRLKLDEPQNYKNDLKLNQSTIEKLGHYVYALIDPRDGLPFYVGKGCGSRINKHLFDARSKEKEETKKLERIHEIESQKLEVGTLVLRHGMTEQEAFEVESAIIEVIGIDNLTNIVMGHDADERGIRSLKDLEIYYQAKPAIFDEPVLLININDKYLQCKNSEDIYEATRSAWKVSATRVAGIKIVCTTYKGIIREVFYVDYWSKHPSRNGRSEFIGKRADETIRNKYINNSIEAYQKRGSQNPIKYVGVKTK